MWAGLPCVGWASHMYYFSQVHSLFSLLTLSHSYVTSIGRLIGVVTLADVRKQFFALHESPMVSHSYAKLLKLGRENQQHKKAMNCRLRHLQLHQKMKKYYRTMNPMNKMFCINTYAYIHACNQIFNILYLLT